ncbi:type III-B CRISPR module-associated Cmr3 family protein [Thermodesulfobacteriota bacterium B35]
MSAYRIVTPTDVLFLRGNRLFGGAGEHGAAEMPPWPSVFAGAVASRILVDQGKIREITAHPDRAEEILAGVAGEDFACTFLGLTHEGRVLLPLPADLVAVRPDDAPETYRLASIVPESTPVYLASSSPLPLLPVLRSSDRAKPAGSLWLDLEGWRRHLDGDMPDTGSLAPAGELWGLDHRLGIGRDPGSRTAAEGKIYTSEAVVLTAGTAFLAGFSGTNIPEDGLLRLGGDGRGAEVSLPSGDVLPPGVGRPEAGWDGFRMILTTPGVFPDGWLPPGCAEEDGGIFLACGGLRAELRAAALGRHGVVSGWDMANHRPKPARRVVPAGSVYWFRVAEGDSGELVELWRRGLYAAAANLDEEYRVSRRREGFSRAWFGAWQPR